MDVQEAERAQACLADLQALLEQAAGEVASAHARTHAARRAAIEQAIDSLRAVDVPIPADLAQEQERLAADLQGVVRSQLFLEAFRRLTESHTQPAPPRSAPAPQAAPAAPPPAAPRPPVERVDPPPKKKKTQAPPPPPTPTDLTARELVPYALDQLGEYATTDRLLSYIQAFYPDVQFADIADVVPQRLAV